jgi:two-component system sensor histidine kinase UhpB
MSSGLAGLYEEIGQALTALRANAAFLLRKSGGQADLQAAARDVQAQGAAIDRRLRVLQHRLPAESTDPQPLVQPMLHAALENWQDVAGVVAPPILLVDPSALRLPRTMLETLCQFSTQALALSAGGPALRVSVLIDDRKSTHLCWSADNGVGLQLTARLPLGAEVA